MLSLCRKVVPVVSVLVSVLVSVFVVVAVAVAVAIASPEDPCPPLLR